MVSPTEVWRTKIKVSHDKLYSMDAFYNIIYYGIPMSSVFSSYQYAREQFTSSISQVLGGFKACLRVRAHNTSFPNEPTNGHFCFFVLIVLAIGYCWYDPNAYKIWSNVYTHWHNWWKPGAIFFVIAYFSATLLNQQHMLLCKSHQVITTSITHKNHAG